MKDAIRQLADGILDKGVIFQVFDNLVGCHT